jgi:putative Mg2+ transporter-C (MgtC) family protein
MPIHLNWQEIATRLALAVVTSAIFGSNRGEHGRPAGFRTTVLVCVAACVAMLQANLLMDSVGKAPDSFVVLDLMRFPLGILSGIGFIGAGTILKRGDIVQGVTTAATMWFVTVMGLCFGGGQIGLGLSAWAIGFGVLWGMRKLEIRIHQDRRATFNLTLEDSGSLSDDQIRAELASQGFKIESASAINFPSENRSELQYLLKWRGHSDPSSLPGVYRDICRRGNVSKAEWRPIGEVKT